MFFITALLDERTQTGTMMIFFLKYGGDIMTSLSDTLNDPTKVDNQL